MENEIIELLKNSINPTLAQHKGSAELVEVKDGVAYLRMHGGCKGCPGKKATLANGLRPFMKGNIAGLQDVQLVD